MRSVVLEHGRDAASPAVYAGAFNKAFEQLFSLKSTDTTELMLVRHAEPDYGAARRSTDPLDPILSERGRCQAIRLSQRLESMNIDALYSSTMCRAVETAAIIASPRDLPVLRSPQLREIAVDPGALNGQTGDPEKLAAQMLLRYLNNPRWDALKGLEPSRQFRHRVIQAIEAIVASHTGQRVVVVTHAGAINAYLSMILGIERDMFFLPEHTSITAVRILNDLHAVQNLNDFSHLLPTFCPS